MAWELNPENQKKFDEVAAEIRRLQTEMGINPMTIDERAAEYRKEKEQRSRLESHLGVRRPAPKWKV